LKDTYYSLFGKFIRCTYQRIYSLINS